MHHTRSRRKLTKRRNRPVGGRARDRCRAARGLRRRPSAAGPAAVAKAGPDAGIRQSAQRRRPAQAHLARQHPRRHFGHAGELAGAAGQHDAVAGGARQAATIQPFLDISKVSSSRGRMMFTTMLRGTLAIWCSSSPTSGTGSISRSSSGEDCTLPYSGLQPFGMRHRGREQAGGEVVGDVNAADRQLRGVQQLPFGEHGHAGGAAAHVDDGGAQVRARHRPAPRARRPSAPRPARRCRDRSGRCRRRASAARSAAASMMCSRAVSVVQNRPRGSATRSVSSAEKVKRQRVDHVAPIFLGPAPTFGDHPADVAFLDRAAVRPAIAR